jgi:hypothetical protein
VDLLQITDHLHHTKLVSMDLLEGIGTIHNFSNTAQCKDLSQDRHKAMDLNKVPCKITDINKELCRTTDKDQCKVMALNKVHHNILDHNRDLLIMSYTNKDLHIMVLSMDNNIQYEIFI